MPCGIDGYIGGNENIFPDFYFGNIQDCATIIGKINFADFDIVSVVAVERRFYKDEISSTVYDILNQRVVRLFCIGRYVKWTER